MERLNHISVSTELFTPSLTLLLLRTETTQYLLRISS